MKLFLEGQSPEYVKSFKALVNKLKSDGYAFTEAYKIAKKAYTH